MQQNHDHSPTHHTHGSYLRFLAMIGTSMVVMFVLMYLHSYQLLDHAWFSETRLFMTMIMGGGMMIVMLLYPPRRVSQQGGQHRGDCRSHRAARSGHHAGAQPDHGG